MLRGLLPVLLVAGGATSPAHSQDAQLPSDMAAIQGPRIEYYLRFAFGVSNTLRKFDHRPKATLICPKPCKGLSDKVWNAIPSGDELQFAESYDPDMDIALISDDALGNEATEVADAKFKKFHREFWGDGRCRVLHFSSNDTVKKFLVIADPKQGDQANTICFAMEMIRGSGLGFWWAYDGLLKATEENQNTFILNMGALLQFHWATLLQPGATKQVVRDAWRGSFGL